MRTANWLVWAAVTAASLVATGSLWGQDAGVEIQIRDTATGSDDYITWAPVPARIRIVTAGAPGPDRVVVLTNDPAGPVPEGRLTPLDGDVVFAESVGAGETATLDALRLTLPGNGGWRSFVVAGRYGRPSSADQDAAIDVHLGTPDGPVVSTHRLMVRVRKDARALTPHERDRFLQAVAHLHFDRLGYVPFVDIHDQAAKGKLLQGTPDYWPDQGHRKAGFLPWHRAFLLAFERELQKDFPDVALPYWRLSQPSSVFSAEFLGANRNGEGEPVPAEFAAGHPLEFWQIGDAKLLRFATPRNDPAQLARFTAEAESLAVSEAFAPFRASVESNPHNNGHGWVGPWMANCMISPRDPLFWVFHTEFDRLWAKWQWKHGRFGTSGADGRDYAPTGSYRPDAPGCSQPQPSGCVPLGHFLQDAMWPWDGSSGPAATFGAARPPSTHEPFAASSVPGLWPSAPASPAPADMIDYAGLGQGRLDMGFAYDDVPFGAQAPAAQAGADKEGLAPAPLVQPLSKVLADRELPDELRTAALRRMVALDERQAIDRAIAVVRNPTDGAGGLDSEAIELLHTQMMFTNAGMERHAEIHGLLRKALSDRRRAVRVAAMSRLGPAGDPEAVRILLRSLEQPAGALFSPGEALHALPPAVLANNTAVVRPYLDHPAPEVRAAAVAALLNDTASRPRILGMITNRSEAVEVRQAAMRSLAHGVASATDPVLAVLADRSADPGLRARAAAVAAFALRASVLPEGERSLLIAGLRRIDRREIEKTGRAAGSLLDALRRAEREEE